MKKLANGDVLLSNREYSFLRDSAKLGMEYSEFFEKQRLEEETKTRLQNISINRGVEV